ncbi:DJ-1/PfpI family protein [Streptomyces sp. NBRC 109706]|uniref:DJ-1/PfpI family protein n=1 Tax=Streptomyces sp. NBRC 109706 TaxID=1550035 RepID=UPI0007859219
MADWETGHATSTLAGHGFRVLSVGPGEEPVTTMGGLRVLPDLPLDRLDPADSALLILPGAGAWMAGDSLAPFAEAAREFVAAGVPVAAICGATVGLARAGLLDDRAHTSGAAEMLTFTGYAGGAHYREADAVTDRGVITAGPTDPEPFAREILARLDVLEPEVLEARFRLYAHSDASAYPILAAAEAAR